MREESFAGDPVDLWDTGTTAVVGSLLCWVHHKSAADPGSYRCGRNERDPGAGVPGCCPDGIPVLGQGTGYSPTSEPTHVPRGLYGIVDSRQQTAEGGPFSSVGIYVTTSTRNLYLSRM